MAGFDAYRTGLRNYVRGFWNGAIDKDQFIDNTRTLINRRLMQAWLEGAARCGITEDEMTEEEWLIIGEIVRTELEYLPGFAEAIAEQRKVKDGKLQPLFNRVEMWALRYSNVVDRAQTLTCGNKKLVWIYGDTQHCKDCLNYNGRVYRASTWAKYDIWPRHPSLGCRGFNCRCRLELTDKPITKGKPPAMTGEKEWLYHTSDKQPAPLIQLN